MSIERNHKSKTVTISEDEYKLLRLSKQVADKYAELEETIYPKVPSALLFCVMLGSFLTMAMERSGYFGYSVFWTAFTLSILYHARRRLKRHD